MNYETGKKYICKTFKDTLIIKYYTERTYPTKKITGAWVLFNNIDEHWSQGKIANFMDNLR